MDSNKGLQHGVQNLEQALALLRKARLVYVHVKLPGYVIGDAEHYLPNCYTAAVKLDKKEAKKMLTDMFHYPREGKVMQISEYHNKDPDRYDYDKGAMVKGREYTSIFIG